MDTQQFEPGYQVMKLLNGRSGLFFQGSQIWESEKDIRLVDTESDPTEDSQNMAAIVANQDKYAVFLNDLRVGNWYDGIVKDGDEVRHSYIDLWNDAPYVVFRVIKRDGDVERTFIVWNGREHGPFEAVIMFEGHIDLWGCVVQRDGKQYMFVEERLYGEGYDEVDATGIVQDGDDIIYYAKVGGKDHVVRNDKIDSAPHDFIYFNGSHHGKNVCDVRDGGKARVLLGEEPLTEEFDELETGRFENGELPIKGVIAGNRVERTLKLP